MKAQSLRRNAFHMLTGQLTLVATQGLQFLLIARAFGPDEFGRIAGVLAVTSALLPFSALGAGNVIVMRYSQGCERKGEYLMNAFWLAAITGLALTAFAATLGTAYYGKSSTSILNLFLLFGLSEIVFTKLSDICAHVFYGLDQHKRSSLIYSTLSIFRLMAAIACSYWIETPSAIQWGVAHLMAGILGFWVALRLTLPAVGHMKLNLALLRSEIKTGIFFSIGLSSKSIYTDIDKAVMPRHAPLADNGAYTAAFRLIYMAFTPINAVLLAAQGRMFRAGAQNGLISALKVSTRISAYGTLYSLAVAGILFWGAPLLVWLLGPEYEKSVDMLRMLCGLPLLLMLQSVFSEALTGAGIQAYRSAAQVIAALACVAMNLSFIPEMGWKGAVYANYGSQALLLALILSILAVKLIRQGQHKPAQA